MAAKKKRRSRGTGRVRIEDVARVAGISAQTVSRFLRAPDKVGPVVSKRVAAAIRQVGYVPNLIAGSLASNQSRVVAILVPTLANPVHASPVEGLGQALREKGYQVLVGTTDYSVAIETDLIRAFLGRRVDGLIVTGDSLSSEARSMLRAARTPLVQLWDLPRVPLDMAVGVSSVEIGRRIARHFVERGYRDVAAVGHDQKSDTRSAGRVAGFVDEARRLGLPPPRVVELSRPMAVRDAVPLIVDLRKGPRPTRAIFTTSGQLAVVMLLDAQKLGLDVPGELAVAGIDGDLATVVRPNLTAARIPAFEFGFKAGELLLRRFAGEPVKERRIDLGFELIVRAST